MAFSPEYAGYTQQSSSAQGDDDDSMLARGFSALRVSALRVSCDLVDPPQQPVSQFSPQYLAAAASSATSPTPHPTPFKPYRAPSTTSSQAAAVMRLRAAAQRARADALELEAAAVELESQQGSMSGSRSDAPSRSEAHSPQQQMHWQQQLQFEQELQQQPPQQQQPTKQAPQWPEPIPPFPHETQPMPFQSPNPMHIPVPNGNDLQDFWYIDPVQVHQAAQQAAAPANDSPESAPQFFDLSQHAASTESADYSRMQQVTDLMMTPTLAATAASLAAPAALPQHNAASSQYNPALPQYDLPPMISLSPLPQHHAALPHNLP